MAKKKKRQGKSKPAAKPAPSSQATKTDEKPEPKAELPKAEVVRAPSPPSKEPAFWFGFEVTWAKLAATRFIVFMLLAVDAATQVSHAPRYGAGDFNVAQLPFMDVIAPGRFLYGGAQLLLAYVFVMVAFGVATRVLVPVGAAIYAWLYLSSQLDSYQHHYLVALVLVIASFVPWQRPAGATPEMPVRTWAVRLILVQLAIMYVWAAISKMDLAWVDGTTLAMQMKGSLGATINKTVGFKVASVMVIATELTLAATIWLRAGWKIAAPLGLLFHLGIVFTGLEIGLFAFLMLGIYALVVPDVVWIAVMRWFRGPIDALSKPSRGAVGAAIVFGIGIAKLVRIEDALVFGLVAAIVPIAILVHALVRNGRPMRSVAVAHALGLLLWLVVDRFTSVTHDYYRFWGGSQRRIGNPETAEYAYRRLTEISPDEESGHFQLGRLLIKRGAIEEGLSELREAQRLEPAIARSFIEEARFLQSQGKTAEAIEKAKQATYADPSSTEARALVDSLTRGKPEKPGTVDDSE